MSDSSRIAAHVAERLRSFQKELQACDDELYEDFSEIPGSQSNGEALQANLGLTDAYWEAYVRSQRKLYGDEIVDAALKQLPNQ